MNTSEQINELATALAKAQGEITGALKDSANPFFKSKYADLASCWDACRGPLSRNGLSVLQPAESDDGGVTVTTTLLHSSGQWVRSALRLQPKDWSPQGVGSAISYGRRYGLTAMIGIAQVDDDGNAASGKVTYGAQPAYDAPHKPQGDLKVDHDAAFKIAVSMRDILDSDVDEDVKCLHVADKSDELNHDQDLYMAAADQLTAAERGAWKKYVAMAKKRQAAEPNGRRF